MNVLMVLLREQEGQGMIEYALIISMIAILAMASLGMSIVMADWPGLEQSVLGFLVGLAIMFITFALGGITEPVKIYAPVISVFTRDPMVLYASVTMRIE